MGNEITHLTITKMIAPSHRLSPRTICRWPREHNIWEMSEMSSSNKLISQNSPNVSGPLIFCNAMRINFIPHTYPLLLINVHSTIVDRFSRRKKIFSCIHNKAILNVIQLVSIVESRVKNVKNEYEESKWNALLIWYLLDIVSPYWPIWASIFTVGLSLLDNTREPHRWCSSIIVFPPARIHFLTDFQHWL